jgi:hypothetical protein
LTIDVEPEDVVAFSSFSVHRTADESDGLVRMAISTRFSNAEEPTFPECGYATPYKFSYRLDLITQGFPSSDMAARVFEKP